MNSVRNKTFYLIKIAVCANACDNACGPSPGLLVQPTAPSPSPVLLFTCYQPCYWARYCAGLVGLDGTRNPYRTLLVLCNGVKGTAVCVCVCARACVCVLGYRCAGTGATHSDPVIVSFAH